MIRDNQWAEEIPGITASIHRKGWYKNEGISLAEKK